MNKEKEENSEGDKTKNKYQKNIVQLQMNLISEY